MTHRTIKVQTRLDWKNLRDIGVHVYTCTRKRGILYGGIFRLYIYIVRSFMDLIKDIYQSVLEGNREELVNRVQAALDGGIPA